jgi:Fur family ferric uptake transcriptional regulator
MEQQIKHLEEIKNIFAAHLETKGLRKTPERFAILEEIYSRTDHFDAESLYSHMLKKEYHVSRATVYNTLELLLTCDLITKHQFGKNWRNTKNRMAINNMIILFALIVKR